MFVCESVQCGWVQNDRNNTLTSCWELPSIRYVPARLCLHITSCLLALWAAFVMVQVNFPSKFQIESQIYDHGPGRCTENTDGQGGSKLGIGGWKRWRRTPTTSQGSPMFCERNWELNQNLCWRQCSANTWWMCPKLIVRVNCSLQSPQQMTVLKGDEETEQVNCIHHTVNFVRLAKLIQ